jgi:hypothetical protein
MKWNWAPRPDAGLGFFGSPNSKPAKTAGKEPMKYVFGFPGLAIGMVSGSIVTAFLLAFMLTRNESKGPDVRPTVRQAMQQRKFQPMPKGVQVESKVETVK